MKCLHPILAQLPQLPLKSLCFLIDGFATTFGTLSLGLIPTLEDPNFQSTTGEPLILPMIIIPLLCGSGASLLVPFFGLFRPQFSFGHPGFLSERLSVDFWGPWLISLCYGTIVDGRGVLFGGLRHLLTHGTTFDWTPTSHGETRLKAWMRPDEAHVLCSLLLSMMYALNEFGPQLSGRTPSTPSKKTGHGNKLRSNETNAGSITATALRDSSPQLSHRKVKK